MAQTFPRGARFADPVVFGAVPAGFYRVTLPFFMESRTKSEDKLKYDSNIGLRIEAVKRITDPRYLAEKWGGDESGLVGMSIFTPNDFIIGLLDSPGPVEAGGQLADPDDWLKTGQGRGGPLFNNMIEASMIDATDDADENCALMEGRSAIVQVRVEREPEGSQYPDKNRIVKFYPVEDEQPARAAAPPRPVAPAARPAAPVRTAPAPARPVAPVARPAAPAPAPARPAPTRAATPPTHAELITCDVCELEQRTAGVPYDDGGADVPKNQLGKHIREMHPES